jgi:organic hydroperoxide reductase OsmC/OhrA
VEFLNVDAETSGTVAKADGVVCFTDIVVRATVTTKGGDAAAVRHAIDKAATRCLVSASLATPVRVEATIRDAADSAAA